MPGRIAKVKRGATTGRRPSRSPHHLLVEQGQGLLGLCRGAGQVALLARGLGLAHEALSLLQLGRGGAGTLLLVPRGSARSVDVLSPRGIDVLLPRGVHVLLSRGVDILLPRGVHVLLPGRVLILLPRRVLILRRRRVHVLRRRRHLLLGRRRRQRLVRRRV